MIVWILEAVEIFIVSVLVQTVQGDLPSTPDQKGVASRFGDPGDKWVGGNLYCAPKRRVNQTEHACAHRLAGYRKHPCGSILILRNPRTKKVSWCRVMDRGPYGADVLSREDSSKAYAQVYYLDKRKRKRKQWYVKIRLKDKPPAKKCPSQDCVGRWRGFLDLSPAVSNDLGHNGMEYIQSWKLGTVLRYQDRKRKLDKLKAAKKNRPKS